MFFVLYTDPATKLLSKLEVNGKRATEEAVADLYASGVPEVEILKGVKFVTRKFVKVSIHQVDGQPDDNDENTDTREFKAAPAAAQPAPLTPVEQPMFDDASPI